VRLIFVGHWIRIGGVRLQALPNVSLILLYIEHGFERRSQRFRWEYCIQTETSRQATTMLVSVARKRKHGIVVFFSLSACSSRVYMEIAICDLICWSFSGRYKLFIWCFLHTALPHMIVKRALDSSLTKYLRKKSIPGNRQ
jgi:hypothetical protein